MCKAYPLNPTFTEEKTVDMNVKKLDLVNLSRTIGLVFFLLASGGVAPSQKIIDYHMVNV